jgi:hypothetical protein
MAPTHLPSWSDLFRPSTFLTLEYRKYQDVDARDKPKTRAALWRGHDEV